MIYCPGAKRAPTGPEVDYTQCPSSCGSGARTGRRPMGGHPLLASFFLVAAGNETLQAGLDPSRAGLSVTLSPVDVRVARARNAARAPGRRLLERETGRRPGSGSDLLRPDSEAGLEDPEPGKRGLGGQPVTPLGRGCRATRPCYRPRRSGERSAQQRSG